MRAIDNMTPHLHYKEQKNRATIQTAGKSPAVEKLAIGCRRCIAGRKLVLFVTGKCNLGCSYCTVSKNRWQKDCIWANERAVERDSDIIAEARACSAAGAGITGGEPLLVIDRTIHYIKLLKKSFGKGFHIHLYTNGKLATPEVLEKLKSAGLDELRIHHAKEAVKRALELNNISSPLGYRKNSAEFFRTENLEIFQYREQNARWKVGMEVPCIPGKEKELCALVDFLEKAGAHFLNLNELEFSDRNIKPMEKKGFALEKGALTAVRGSKGTGLKVLRHARTKKLSVHFCTAALKLNCQLRNRLRNRAKNIRKPFEIVTREGFLLKGIILADDLGYAVKTLKKAGIRQFFINANRKRIELSVKDARRLAGKLPLKFAIVKEYPSAEPWDWELTPLNMTPLPRVRQAKRLYNCGKFFLAAKDNMTPLPKTWRAKETGRRRRQVL